MEKILLAIDSQHMDANAIRFACFLSRLTRSRLTGIFLDDLIVEEEVVIRQTGGVPVIESVSIQEAPENDDQLTAKVENITRFKEITEEEGIQAFVHLNKGVPANEIIAESRFADILIVDAATSFSGIEEGTPTRFVKDILQEAECPVIISPDNFNGIDNIVFCYDGGKSSIFAMKQFSYLFPELRNTRAKVIDMNGADEFSEEARVAVTNWLKYHYSDVEPVTLEEDATTAFFDYLRKKRNDLVVMGAYGKGLLASFFGNGTEEESAGTTSLPIFIAHY